MLKRVLGAELIREKQMSVDLMMKIKLRKHVIYIQHA